MRKTTAEERLKGRLEKQCAYSTLFNLPQRSHLLFCNSYLFFLAGYKKWDYLQYRHEEILASSGASRSDVS